MDESIKADFMHVKTELNELNTCPYCQGSNKAWEMWWVLEEPSNVR